MKITSKNEGLEILNKSLADMERILKALHEIQFDLDSGVDHYDIHVMLKYGRAFVERNKNMIKEVERYRPQKFCHYLESDDEGVYCSAHIHTARVLHCPYVNSEDAKTKCSDFKVTESN